jgi:short-subunit dehydrogenase
MTTHVLVTGAAGAIGSALARGLRARFPAARLSLTDRQGPLLEGLAAELGAEAIVADLSEPGAVPALLARVGDTVDGLVNAAGIMEVRRLETLPWERAAELMQVDLTAPLQLMHALVGALVAAGRPGFVINVTSMAGRVPLQGCTFYGAAKAGLSMASEIARAELAPRGIRVLTVYPGPVSSALEQGARAQYEPARLPQLLPTGDPKQLASRVLDALERGSARVIYPRVYALGYRAALAEHITLGLGPRPIT